MTFFSQARRTCGTTHFIRLCTILHATGFGLPPNFEDCGLDMFIQDSGLFRVWFRHIYTGFWFIQGLV